MSTKKVKNEQFLQISFYTDMKSTKNAILQQNKPEINPFKVNSLLESNCKRYLQSSIRENVNPKPEPQLKKTHSEHGGNYTDHYNEVKEKL